MMQTAKDLAASLRARTRIDYGSGCEADLPNDCAAMLDSLAERIAAVEKLFTKGSSCELCEHDVACMVESALKGKP